MVPAPVLPGQSSLADLPKDAGLEVSGAVSVVQTAYRSMLKTEFLWREELEDEQAEHLVKIIKAKL